jgi:hypothetical protein
MISTTTEYREPDPQMKIAVSMRGLLTNLAMHMSTSLDKNNQIESN